MEDAVRYFEQLDGGARGNLAGCFALDLKPVSNSG